MTSRRRFDLLTKKSRVHERGLVHRANATDEGGGGDGLKLRPRRSNALPCGALVLGSPKRRENETRETSWE